jgi:hypothetical protein
MVGEFIMTHIEDKDATAGQIKKTLKFLNMVGVSDKGLQPCDVPRVPSNFVPRTPTEVLRLTVFLPDKYGFGGLQRTFNAWWWFIDASGLIKWRDDSLKSDSEHLRLALSIEQYQPGIRWVAFDPATYMDLSPQDALVQAAEDDTRLAGVEVLMATALFPQWIHSWCPGGSPYPNMAGLQLRLQSDWSHVPYLRQHGSGQRLNMYAGSGSTAPIYNSCANPTVREC